MKLRFNRTEASDALSAICSVAGARTTKEILKCVRLEARSDVLMLSATDLELSLSCAVAQVEVEEPGEALVVADTLAKIVRECSDELLQVETRDTKLDIRGEGSHFQIVTHDAATFPAIPSMEGKPDSTIEYGALNRLVELTIFAAAHESTRYAINGVLWDVEGAKLTLAATDGRRLAVAHGELSGDELSGQTKAIVPSKALSILGRLSMEPDTRVGIQLKENQLLLSLGRASISTSLVEGRFPKYQDVIPSDCDREVQLNTSDFHSALKRAALLTNEESKGVRFCFDNGTLTLSSRAPEQGEATISFPVEFKGEKLEIGFNPAFLFDVLRVIHEDELVFALKAENRPGVVRLGQHYTYVIMPVNLSSA